MIRSLLSVATLFTTTSALVADDKKEHKLAVSFSTPSPAYKASIASVREVGKELWVRVDVITPNGEALAVIGKAKAEATITGPALPVKYFVFGKSWTWKNKEKDIVFLQDLPEKDRTTLEKTFADGKLVFEAKPKNSK